MVGLRSLLVAICLSLAWPLVAQVPDSPPLSAYGALPAVEDMALSPGGTRIAALTTLRGERVLVILNDRFEAVRTTGVGDVKVRSIEWIGDDQVLMQISQTEELGYGFTADQHEFWRALILPEDPSEQARFVFGDDRTILDAVFGNYGLRRRGDRWMLHFGGVELERGVEGMVAPHYRPALFAFDVARNGADKIAPAGAENHQVDWLVAADGTVAATFDIETVNGRWKIKGPRGQALAQGVAPQGDAWLVSLGPGGATVIYSSLDERGDAQWFEVPLDASAAPSVFLPDQTIERLFHDEGGNLIGLLKGGSDAGPEFFSAEHQAIVRKVYRAFRGLDVTLIDWTPDFSRVLVRTSGNRDSGTWYMVDVAQLRAEAVGAERPAIAPEQVGAISTIAYTADDGLELDGILTLPPGREAKGLPLVMLPHGGPHAHDEEVFDWWAQAFASRGYAVFQPNFRGSTGRGEDFIRAGYGQWGRSMQSDISDGLEALTRAGIVDPARACIVGASYGGYAALAGVTLQQGLYRCAVAVAGVSDLTLMYNTDYRESGQQGLLRRSLLEELGPRSGFAEVSPRRFAAQADAPILLIHGRDDTVVPFAQSTRMADALKDAGKPHRLVELREEDHWLSRSSTRMQMLEETMAFVQEHNPAD